MQTPSLDRACSACFAAASALFCTCALVSYACIYLSGLTVDSFAVKHDFSQKILVACIDHE